MLSEGIPGGHVREADQSFVSPGWGEAGQGKYQATQHIPTLLQLNLGLLNSFSANLKSSELVIKLKDISHLKLIADTLPVP